MVERRSISAGLLAGSRVNELRQLAECHERERAREPGSRKSSDDLKAFGRQLYDRGGEALMAAVYDGTVDRHGFGAVFGVSAAWTGIGEWAA